MGFAGMRRVSPGFYDDGHGGLHIDVDEFVTAAGGDPRNPLDVERAVEVIREKGSEIGAPVLEMERP